MSSRGHLLVVDDDEALLQLLNLSLSNYGYEVTCVSNGRDALKALFAHPLDLVILDIMLPEMSGWDVCRRIREVSDIPILMLTAYSGQEQHIKGLELGADDYVNKPFDVRELTLRVGALLRRTWDGQAGPKRARFNRRYDDGHLFVDLDERIVQYDGRPIRLSPNEFDLLACFVRHPGNLLSHDYLLHRVWGLDAAGRTANYVKTYISYLRKKIEPDPKRPRYIITERGIGYRLERRGAGRIATERDGEGESTK